MNTKICFRCEKEKSISEFDKDKSKKDGLQAYCRKCSNEYNKEYQLNHPRKHWCKETICSHKRRGYKVLFTSNDLLPLAEKTTRCPICEAELNWKYGTKKRRARSNSPSLDRKTNKKTLTLKNVWIICRKCNATKQDRTFEEFVDYCRMIVNKF